MRWMAIFVMVAAVAGCSGADIDAFQADPLSVSAPGSPNWVLAAPREVDPTAEPTIEVPIYATGPAELLGYVDTVARADDRVEAVEPVWPTSGLARAYVQRSATFGFPDVISIEAIDLGAGDAGQRASLVIFSRSVYGYSDLGVNTERVRRWLTRLSEIAPVVDGRRVEN